MIKTNSADPNSSAKRTPGNFPRIMLTAIVLTTILAAIAHHSSAKDSTKSPPADNASSGSAAKSSAKTAAKSPEEAKTAGDKVSNKLDSNTSSPKDAISELILSDQKNIPRTPLAFLKKLQEAGLKVRYHIVANGGIQNTNRGSFSCFGTVSGRLKNLTLRDQDFSFGVFIEPNKDKVLCVQNDFGTKLLVEVIAKDFNTGVKNFWELIGEPEAKTANWHFRTNSFGIKSDVARINMQSNPLISKDRPLFGKISRCSGCHTNGDMVMKELDAPHNDWLHPGEANIAAAIGKFKLEKGSNTDNPSHVAAIMFKDALDPEDLAATVRDSLAAAIRIQARSKLNKESDKQKLRCLVAPLEMNLVSDSSPYQKRLKSIESIAIPSSFFVDERITGKMDPVCIHSKVYSAALRDLGSSFAADETRGLIETENAFLIPQRSFADENGIDNLVDTLRIDDDTLMAILNVDWTTPIYSKKRLALMDSIPDKCATAADLRKSLSKVIEIKEDGRKFYQYRGRKFLHLCYANVSNIEVVKAWIKLAAQRRVEIQAAQSSKNPRGSILEGGLGPGGFRRIFPEYKAFKPEPYKYHLDPTTTMLKVNE